MKTICSKTTFNKLFIKNPHFILRNDVRGLTIKELIKKLEVDKDRSTALLTKWKGLLDAPINTKTMQPMLIESQEHWHPINMLTEFYDNKEKILLAQQRFNNLFRKRISPKRRNSRTTNNQYFEHF